MKRKINFIKNLFNTMFPYEINFRTKFFDYIENKSEEEDLEIIGLLLQILSNKQEQEKKMIIESITNALKERGISTDINLSPKDSL